MLLSKIIRKLEIFFWTASIRLMENRKAVRIVLTALVLLSLGGVLAIMVEVFHPGQTALQTPQHKGFTVGSSLPADDETATPVKGQSNLLVILVDDLSIDKPELIGTWLVGHAGSIPQVIFLPIFPSSRQSDSVQFTSLFGLEPNGKPVEVFLDFLRAKDIWWNHYLVADNTSIAELAALTDGIRWDGKRLKGSVLNEALPTAQDTPQAAITAQARIASELCQSASDLIQEADPEVLWGLLTHRIRSDLRIEAIRSAQVQIGKPDGKPVCEFPTLREAVYEVSSDGSTHFTEGGH
jgi:hypothetical protein